MFPEPGLRRDGLRLLKAHAISHPLSNGWNGFQATEAELARFAWCDFGGFEQVLGLATKDDAPLPPLAVDLDGTLTTSDTLHEGCLAYVKTGLQDIVDLAARLGEGKAAFKRAVADRTEFDAALLPYNEELLAYLKAQRRAGRTIALVTAADQSIADAVAAHLGLFDMARGSQNGVNLSGTRKLAVIREMLGDRFVYAGDGPVDAPIFAAAESVVLVGNVARLKPLLPAGKSIEQAFHVKRAGARTWAKALRVQHWAKNTLVFVAPILGFSHATPALAFNAVLLFLAMGVLASATYIINDLLDLPSDRQHPRKRHRPFASGSIAPRDGVFAALGLFVLAGLMALALPAAAAATLVAYAGVTLTYSLILKRQPIIDVFVLAGLFTLRVLAGSLLAPQAVSPWLLTFSMLIFLGLAMVKRYAELNRVVQAGGTGVVSRGYTVRDLPLLLAAGVSSSFCAIVIFMVYLINEQYPSDIYRHPGMLWALMPLVLIWVLRVWHLTVHGRMSEDPVVFALKDRFSLALGILALLTLWAAS
ncbi:UbiA family prenyltransferase [Xanthobacter sp. DSM 24535]|uniref:UbiA family prenyltransferase n=1 Tax=Roseixanthobacter psychrophilus TaxID=3119917 RepID=UPI00372A8FC7